MALPDARAAIVNLGGGLRQSLNLAIEADRGLAAKGVDLRQRAVALKYSVICADMVRS
ncbi:hypothetical protein [Cypionkella psychrotolerans]|uniref:hypothetical protein n=1 Tax=Cypionkella psychrotolerans TaxID=1678131 RepID=UPI0012E2BD8D|nr:hypothetical protein [Cypionkella psychrotolerans]